VFVCQLGTRGLLGFSLVVNGSGSWPGWGEQTPTPAVYGICLIFYLQTKPKSPKIDLTLHKQVGGDV